MASTTPDSHIYLGPWINWDHGPILGATLTLSPRDGGLFNSFLATFITIVGAQLWRILSYAFHQARSSKGPQDGLHHQHQNIFRNTSSPGGAAWSFLRMSTAWKNKTRYPILRSLPWALLAIFYMCLFAVLSVFQSQTTKSTGNDRLVIGDTCGYWRVDAGLTTQEVDAFTQKTTNDTLLAANYARACYGGSPNRLQCSLYPTMAIPWIEDRKAKCPFQNEICRGNAFKMDTGLVDSHSVLGINAPSVGRIQYRKVTTCTPLHLKGYINVLLGTGDNGALQGDVVYQVEYGHSESITASVILNYTFAYNLHATLDNFGYSVDTVYALAQVSNTWHPIPALNRTDADISVITLSANSMRFTAPVDDPIFSAHQLESYLTYSGQNISWYVSDEYVAAIGCAEHHQICNPINKICTALGGTNQLEAESLDPSLDLNPVQVGAMLRISSLATYTSVYETVNPRQAAALRAQETVTDLQQAPIPDDQWIIEVSNWFNNGLAHLQRGIVEYATGPTNVVPGLSVFLPDDVVSKAMCYSQKITDPQGTISFSLLGVAIILSVGGFLIVTSLVLDAIIGWSQKKFRWGEYARLNWISDDKLQLQRMAFEAAGMAHWEGHTSAIPTTTTPEAFGGWDGVDPERPTLLSHGRGSDETLGFKEHGSFMMLQNGLKRPTLQSRGGDSENTLSFEEQGSYMMSEEGFKRRSPRVVVHEFGLAI